MIENFRVKVFRAVAEEGSFRKAAEILHLSQPAVSQQVHALEEELGLRLLDRKSAHISLTAAGKILLRYARKASRMAQEVEAELANLRGETGGELRLGASTTVAQYILPRILGAFLKENPKVQLQVKSGNTEEVVNWLTSGLLDLGLIEGPALSKQVQTEHFLEDSMVLIVPPNHPWGAEKIVSVSEITGVPLLLRERGSGSRRVVESALKAKGVHLKDLQIAMELDSTEAIVSGVEVGLGVGFVSEWAVGKELHLGTVMTVHVEDLKIHRQFTLVRVAGPVPEGAAGVFRRFALSQGEEPIRKSNQA